MTTKIVIRERGDDYMAYIEGHPEIWGCGKNVNAAVGDLVLSHQKNCDIEIVYYEREYERLNKKEETEKETLILKIGEEIECPIHGKVKIDGVDNSVPQNIVYQLSCGHMHPHETIGRSKIAKRNLIVIGDD